MDANYAMHLNYHHIHFMSLWLIFHLDFLTDLDLFNFFGLSSMLLLQINPSGIRKGSKSNAPEARCCCLLLELPD